MNPRIEIAQNNESNLLLDYCKRILSRLDEQSARMSLIEDAMQLKDRKKNLVQKNEESRSFAIANRLPLNNGNDLKMFEENLNNFEFQNIAVSSFFCSTFL